MESFFTASKLHEIWKLILLFNEHTWGALHSVIRPRWEFTKKVWKQKASYAYKAREELDKSFLRARKAFVSLFSSDKKTKIVIFNPLSWQRKGLVRLMLPPEFAESEIKIIDDLSNKEVKIQREKDYIYFIAEEIPPLGFKTFSVIKKEKRTSMQENNSTKNRNFIENEYYRISFEGPADIVIIDRENNKKFTKNKGRFRFNQLIYVSGGAGTRIVNYSLEKLPDLKIHTVRKIGKVLVKKGRVMEKLILNYEDLPFFKNVISELVLYRKLKAIEIRNSFYKEETFRKEALYFAFPFNLKSPEIYLEIPGGWMRPEKDQIKGACKEWYSVQNWIALLEKDYGVVLSAPDSHLFTIGDINRGRWPDKLELKEPLIFAYLLNNYWFTNYKAGQGGNFLFRFYLFSSRKLDLTESVKKGWEFVFPLRAFLLLKGNRGIIKKPSGSFLKISVPNVILSAFKKAEAGDGFVLRLREIEGKRTHFSLIFPYFRIEEALLCDITEKNLFSLPFEESKLHLDIFPYDILTVKIRFKNRSLW